MTSVTKQVENEMHLQEKCHFLETYINKDLMHRQKV